MDEFETTARRYRARLARVLNSYLPAARMPAAGAGAPRRLHSAMRYAVLQGGKRVRAMLVYGSGRLAGANLRHLDAAAAAVECMHAYSLIHDDLPAMDDDAVRRGRPACHVKFDEPTAILAGDALQTLAFEILAAAPAVPAARKLQMLSTLAAAAGAAGMAGGQAMDIAQARGAKLSLAQLQRMHTMKTAALIRAAARLGGLCARPVTAAFLARVDDYAAHLGLAFQIMDDVLDADDGGDARLQKVTFVSKLGRKQATARARNLARQAIATLPAAGDASAFLQHLARFAVRRSF